MFLLFGFWNCWLSKLSGRQVLSTDFSFNITLNPKSGESTCRPESFGHQLCVETCTVAMWPKMTVVVSHQGIKNVSWRGQQYFLWSCSALFDWLYSFLSACLSPSHLNPIPILMSPFFRWIMSIFMCNNFLVSTEWLRCTICVLLIANCVVKNMCGWTCLCGNSIVFLVGICCVFDHVVERRQGLIVSGL